MTVVATLAGRLSSVRAGHATAVVALSATVAAAAIIVVAQPIGSPWWTYADADASYSAASLNLLRGTSIRYLDHPGLPMEELGAVVFGAEHAVQRATGNHLTTNAFVDQRMLDLGHAKTTWRTLAIIFYFLGALLSCVLPARYFRDWLYGLAGGLLWLGAPGLVAMSIQFRPDVALAALLVAVTYLLGRAAETRSAALYGWALFGLGFTMMVKLHATGMLAAVAILAIARPPQGNWAADLRARLSAFARRRRVPIGVVAFLWILLAAYLNRGFRGYSFSRTQMLAIAIPVAVLVAYGAAVRMARGNPRLRRVFDPFFAFLGCALLAGLVVPITFDVPDGLTSLIHIKEGLLGGGINTGVPLFGAPLHPLIEPPLRSALVVFVLAGIGAVVGLRRRDPVPVAWFAGAAILGVMAQARLATLHYFAPAYVVSMFGALWLVRAVGARLVAAAALAVLVAYVVVPQFQDRSAPGERRARVAEVFGPQMHYVESLLHPGQVALAPPTWPSGSDWYSYVVQPVVNYTPPYPYTFVEADSRGADEAAEAGLHLAYYTGPGIPATSGVTTMRIGDIGTFRVKVLTPKVVRLLTLLH